VTKSFYIAKHLLPIESKLQILDDKRFAPFIANIQLESTNSLLQGSNNSASEKSNFLQECL
jgi:hypothetical protein